MSMGGQKGKTITLFLISFLIVYIFGNVSHPLSSFVHFEYIISGRDIIPIVFWIFLFVFSYIIAHFLSRNMFVFYVLLFSTLFVIIFGNLALLGDGFLGIFLYSRENEINKLGQFFEWAFVFGMFFVSSLYFLWSFVYFLRRYTEGILRIFLSLYMIYVCILLLLYFGFYRDDEIRKIERVDENYFRLETMDVQENDNMAIALYNFGKQLETEKTFFYDLRNEIDPFGKGLDIGKIKNLNQQTITKIDDLQRELEEISQKKYFQKQEYISYTRVIGSFMKYISFYNALYYIEQGNIAEGLSIVSNNYRLGMSLLNSQGEFIDTLFGLTNQVMYLSHIEYILDSYSLDNTNLLYIKSFLEEETFDTSFRNMLTVALHENFEQIKDYTVYPNIFFNKELYINIERYIFKNIIEGNTDELAGIGDFSEYRLKDSYLLRTLVTDAYAFEDYREDIKKLTEKYEQIIQNIDAQVKRKLLLDRFRK